MAEDLGMYLKNGKPHKVTFTKENIRQDIIPILLRSILLCFCNSLGLPLPFVILAFVSRKTDWFYFFITFVIIILSFFGWLCLRYLLQLGLTISMRFKIEESSVCDKHTISQYHIIPINVWEDPELPDNIEFKNRKIFRLSYRTIAEINNHWAYTRHLYYKWSVNSMTTIGVYESTEVGDNFYLITFEGKNPLTKLLLYRGGMFKKYNYLMIYNKKFFEYIGD